MMRADRLLTMLLLLQSRGQLTAEELAAELGVSPRTIYRDAEALSVAGIPIYAEAGPGGGYALLENYRTSLTGLNQDEVRALFMLALPETLAEFGLAPELRSAMLKLSAALPPAWRQEGRSQNPLYLDLRGSRQPAGADSRLPKLYDAICHDRRLEVHYRLPFGSPASIVQTIDPLGLVARAGDWHLVYRRRNRIRARPVHAFNQVHRLPSSFERPPDFDLVTWWHSWIQRSERDRTTFVVKLRIAPELAQTLAGYLGPATLLDLAEPDHGTWCSVTLAYPDLPTARTHLLGLGRSVEVLSPLALRLSMQDFARQVVQLYARK